MYENSKIVRPITPDEAIQAKNNNIRPEVVEAVNELIAINISMSGVAKFTQDALAELVVKKMSNQAEWRAEAVRKLMFEERWLDVEPLFRSYGWKVEFDSPGYNESYSATFKFSR